MAAQAHPVIRMATPADAPALLEIYSPYVTDTTVSFEYVPPSCEEFAGRIRTTLEKYPYLVAELEGRPVGYAYASPFHHRAAYGWSAETSIYVRRDLRRGGAGRSLYLALEEILTRQGVLNLNACIAWPNPDSVAFHEKLGYRHAGHFHQCGYKLGQWLDVIWMEKDLGPHTLPPRPFIPVGSLGD